MNYLISSLKHRTFATFTGKGPYAVLLIGALLKVPVRLKPVKMESPLLQLDA